MRKVYFLVFLCYTIFASIDECEKLIDAEAKHLCNDLKKSKKEEVRIATDLGGFSCRFVLVIGRILDRRRHDNLDVAWHDAIDAFCGKKRQREKKVAVISVQHNGLGNQLFQFALSRLLALSLGGPFFARLIRDYEGPMSIDRLPPHSTESWNAFQFIFAQQQKSIVDDNDTASLNKCVPRLIPSKSQFFTNGTALLAERPADTRRLPMQHMLRNAFHPNSTCLKTLGYFQHYALLRGYGTILRNSLLRIRDDLILSQEPTSDDIVIHIRLCNGPIHHYHYYTLNNYFRHILVPLLSSSALPRRNIKIISGCNPNTQGVVSDLIRTYGAILVHPTFYDDETNENQQQQQHKKRRNHHPIRSIAADFVYLTRAKTLILTESTYAFWSGFLNRGAMEIHAPASGPVPIPYAEPNYIFHDIHKGRYWGKYVKNQTDGIIFSQFS
mmetsp:Transcript_7564/g.11335  ORF Transcript_7564/g.11335 Transcript_7564/m.11335 type:complete len:441 (+) Transcript_7564:1118-2440(+)